MVARIHKPEPGVESLSTPANCVLLSRILAFLAALRRRSDDRAASATSEGNCLQFFNSVVAPEWANRQKILDYCDNYQNKLRVEAQQQVQFPTEVSNEDLKQDPYALKSAVNQMEQLFAVCDAVAAWVRTERGVERIITEQTAASFDENCGITVPRL